MKVRAKCANNLCTRKVALGENLCAKHVKKRDEARMRKFRERQLVDA